MAIKQEEKNQVCLLYRKCRDTPASWFFLFVGLIATISLRAVNLFLEISPIWAKAFWYIGVCGFLIYFLYKFRQDRNTQRELAKRSLAVKLSCRDEISTDDREFLKNILCKLESNKDSINYFFIFFSSGIALLLGIYFDFIKQ